MIALTLLGFLTANLIGRTLVDLGETAARPHAGGARDLSRPEAGVRDAVLGQGVELPPGRPGRISSPGMWSIVLISQSPSVDIASKLAGQEEHISVFLPCAPNPTTGFFFYVPKSKIIEVDMSHRRRRDPDHVGRRGAARLRPAETQCRRAGRHGERGARGELGSRAAAGSGEGGIGTRDAPPPSLPDRQAQIHDAEDRSASFL